MGRYVGYLPSEREWVSDITYNKAHVLVESWRSSVMSLKFFLFFYLSVKINEVSITEKREVMWY